MSYCFRYTVVIIILVNGAVCDGWDDVGEKCSALPYLSRDVQIALVPTTDGAKIAPVNEE